MGPHVPEGFYEELELKDQRDKEAAQKQPSILMTSYRRPRRQRQQESTLHPQDEKKILAEINFKEQQRREVVIRQEMKKLLEDSKK